jgi:hypothetical protein
MSHQTQIAVGQQTIRDCITFFCRIPAVSLSDGSAPVESEYLCQKQELGGVAQVVLGQPDAYLATITT